MSECHRKRCTRCPKIVIKTKDPRIRWIHYPRELRVGLYFPMYMLRIGVDLRGRFLVQFS